MIFCNTNQYFDISSKKISSIKCNVYVQVQVHDMIFIYSFLKHFRQTKIACDSKKPHIKKKLAQFIRIAKVSNAYFSVAFFT